MDSNTMNPGDEQFIFFENSSHVNVDLGTPNQHLVGQLQSDPGINQDQNFYGQKEPNAQRNFWTVEYYQKFFNVSTEDVVARLKRSMIPHGVDDYLITHIRPNPDLYGPFWVCVTLIFTIAISGNLSNYFQSARVGNYHWKYEFHIVSHAATCIFLYAWLLPLLLWGALIWTKNQEEQIDNELIQSSNTSIGLLELICLYGYSLTIYIPVAFLWTIQISLLQWSLVIVATVLSGGVLLRSLMPVIPGKKKLAFITIILGMHLLLAAGFMLYFFHVPSNLPDADIIKSSTTTTTTLAPAIKINAAEVHPNNSAPSKSI